MNALKLIVIAGVVLLALPVIALVSVVGLIDGTENAACSTPGDAAVPGGTAAVGMFAAPLSMAPDTGGIRVGATEYDGPSSYGSSGAYLPADPDSFAELSVLDSNPANSGRFTFQDANALDNLPYGTAIRVANGAVQKVLYKRDVGYGQGPGQSIPYRIDVWYQAAAPLGISKTPVDIELAPASGTAGTLGQLPTTTSAAASGAPVRCDAGDSGPLPLTAGQQASILPDGLAAAPASAPAAVKLAIAAGNALIDLPYLYGGGHGQPLTELASAYDCSSSTSYILHGAGAFGSWPQDSTELESYGDPGPGRWITVYANSHHAFIDIAGVVMDTAWYAPVTPTSPGSGPRWQPESIIPAQYAGDSYGGFVQRHPPGL